MIVRENISFERGINPKKAMGIGKEVTIIAKDSDKKIKGIVIEKDEERTKKNLWGEQIYTIKITEGEFKNKLMWVAKFDTLFGEYWGIEDSIIPTIDEHQNFERGMDPKKAMKIGKESWWDDIIENTPWYMELGTYGDFKVIDLIKDYRGVSPIIVIRIEQNDIRVEPTYWYIGVSKVDKTDILDTPEEALHDAKIDIENWEYRVAENRKTMNIK